MTYPNIIEYHNNLINIIYPVGAIYMSTNNVSPATFLGGTWEQIQDKFLLCCGSSYAAGSTGGSASVALTTAQLPSHTHTASSNSTGNHKHNVYVDGNFCAVSTGNINSWKQMLVNVDGNLATNCSATHTTGAHTHTVTVDATGSGSAHNNMPPYLAVYCWRRTA